MPPESPSCVCVVVRLPAETSSRCVCHDPEDGFSFASTSTSASTPGPRGITFETAPRPPRRRKGGGGAKGGAGAAVGGAIPLLLVGIGVGVAASTVGRVAIGLGQRIHDRFFNNGLSRWRLLQWEAANSARYGSSKTFSANSPGTASGRSGGSGGPRDGAGRDVGNGVGSYMGNGTESDDDAIDAKSPNGTTLAKMDRKTFSIMLQVFSLHWDPIKRVFLQRVDGDLLPVSTRQLLEWYDITTLRQRDERRERSNGGYPGYVEPGLFGLGASAGHAPVPVTPPPAPGGGQGAFVIAGRRMQG